MFAIDQTQTHMERGADAVWRLLWLTIAFPWWAPTVLLRGLRLARRWDALAAQAVGVAVNLRQFYTPYGIFDVSHIEAARWFSVGIRQLGGSRRREELLRLTVQGQTFWVTGVSGDGAQQLLRAGFRRRAEHLGVCGGEALLAAGLMAYAAVVAAIIFALVHR
ncbi:MAG TPA: hypothetical protein PLF40_04670 [Kofleriaceae bacterium]|nr:hypothetical protein [Kofleriaceae bacterium]